MEEVLKRGDLHVKVVKQSSFWQGSGYVSTLSPRSTPRNSPTHRTPRSSRTPRKEARAGGGIVMKWFRSNSSVYWLLLISLWVCAVLYFQSGWDHNNKKDDFPGFGHKAIGVDVKSVHNIRKNVITNDSSLTVKSKVVAHTPTGEGRVTDVLLVPGGKISSPFRTVSRKRNRRSAHRSRGKGRNNQQTAVEVESIKAGMPYKKIIEKNSTLGWFVGPFGSSEDIILGLGPEERSGTCDGDGDFARLVHSRKFLLIFHELSMTGAPISMMELATELLSCGATVSAVVLSRRGGLMPELARRKIEVLDDRAELSFKTARKADLVIAGSAVCASWIEKYVARYPARSSQIAWWIMENRREYFDRSKAVLSKVKVLMFLSDIQSKQWLTWCQEENIKLVTSPMLVPLSVNDELAFVAGIPCSLNSPSITAEIMMEKRKVLRDSVRKQMGLTSKDMLVITLSSINPGKGQLLLLESANLVIENTSGQASAKLKAIGLSEEKLSSSRSAYSRVHFQGLPEKLSNVSPFSSKSSSDSTRKSSALPGLLIPVGTKEGPSQKMRRILSDQMVAQEQNLKILIGSVGSKSNKVPYVDGIMKFLSQHSNLSRSVLWTPATTRVASLYSAADVYVINSQGMGETFGRVTVEAMAFGLPVLGTDAGGTREIVEHNETGLLHLPGRAGNRILAHNLRFLLKNPAAREQMGMKGRKKVELQYLKRHMYSKFGQVLSKCMAI